jgi:hypothetical protein
MCVSVMGGARFPLTTMGKGTAGEPSRYLTATRVDLCSRVPQRERMCVSVMGGARFPLTTMGKGILETLDGAQVLVWQAPTSQLAFFLSELLGLISAGSACRVHYTS